MLFNIALIRNENPKQINTVHTFFFEDVFKSLGSNLLGSCCLNEKGDIMMRRKTVFLYALYKIITSLLMIVLFLRLDLISNQFCIEEYIVEEKEINLSQISAIRKAINNKNIENMKGLFLISSIK